MGVRGLGFQGRAPTTLYTWALLEGVRAEVVWHAMIMQYIGSCIDT